MSLEIDPRRLQPWQWMDLARTMAWCIPRTTSNPFGLRDAELAPDRSLPLMDQVRQVANKRALLLKDQLPWQTDGMTWDDPDHVGIFRDWAIEKGHVLADIFLERTVTTDILQGGGLLHWSPGRNLTTSSGFFDEFGGPPWSTWCCPLNSESVLCWIPPEQTGWVPLNFTGAEWWVLGERS